MPESIDDRLAAAGLPRLPRGVWLEIDEAALAQNLAVFRELVGEGVELNAVVKADAYGHGLKPVARVFESAGADRLCVAALDEALALREAGITIPILVLFPIAADAMGDAAQKDIQIAVSDPATLPSLANPASRFPGLLSVELEVDTGLTRGGVKVEEVPEALKSVRTWPKGLELGIWTHVATPENEEATAKQVAEFERATRMAHEAGELVPARHMAATGGLLTGRVPAYEGVRIGLGLYGLLPLDLPMPDRERAFADRLQPAMRLKCRPLRIQRFAAGTPVGYSGKWQTPRESVIVTLPIGYADALPRSTWPGAEALVRGQRVPLVGNVAMDAVMADVTNVPGISMDDEFVLLGEQGDQKIDAYELARARNTIPWEALTGMNFRIPRVYHAGSVLMGLRTLNGETRVQATLLSTEGVGEGLMTDSGDRARPAEIEIETDR